MNIGFITPQTKGHFIKASAFAILLAIAEIGWQYISITGLPAETQLYTALARGFALTGATLIGIALLIGPVARLWPKYNLIVYRRYLGVAGFVNAALHMYIVLWKYFGFDMSQVYYSFNPLVNPIVWGNFAFWIFFFMAITSADKIILKINYKNWKRLHSLGYIAYLFVILHFTRVNPALLVHPASMILIGVAGLVPVLQLLGFLKTIKQQTPGKLGIVYAIIVIGLWIVLLYWAFGIAPVKIG